MTSSIGSVPPPSPLSYTGSVFVQFITRPFPPQNTFNTFQIGTIWLDIQAFNAYILVSKALGVADWILIGGSPGPLNTITTPDSVVVVPSAGNINFLETGSISITGSGNNITFDVTGGGLTWVEVTGISQDMLADSGYIANNPSLVTLTLPPIALLGSIIEVVGKGAGGWTIAQNGGQTIYFGTASTTTGATGTLSSTLQRDSVRLVCITANTDFEVVSSIGNFTIV